MLRFESFAFMFKPLPGSSTKTKQTYTRMRVRAHTHTRHQKVVTSQVSYTYNKVCSFASDATES